MADLYDYQSTGLKWMLNKERAEKIKGGVLADEVGLGKTLMSISVIKENPQKNTLVLVPKSLMTQWKEEFGIFGAELNVEIYDEKSVLNNDTSVSKVIIASHSQLNAKNIDYTASRICNMEWDRVIIDEAHVIKNKKSKIHKASCCLKAPIKWALTATPIMNKMDDFINILGWVGVPQDVCQGYKEDVSEQYILRRTKEDVSFQNEHLKLPTCTVNVNRIPFESSIELNMYISVYSELKEAIENMAEHDTKDMIRALELFLRIRQVCCHPQTYMKGVNKKKKKKEELEKYPCTKLTQIIESIKQVPRGEKALIFCHFITEMDAYCEALEELKIGHRRLQGSMNITERAENVEEFNNSEECKVFVVQINTGGVGYNFQCANWIYITSPTWNPSLQHQVIGRSHRTGQTKEVTVNVYTIGEGEDVYVEDYITSLQSRKLKMIAEILKDERICDSVTNNSSISFDDIAKMFK